MKIKTIFFSVFMITMLLCGHAHARDYSAWIDACEPYRDVVERILDNERVSRDFYYLMVAESRCANNAISNKGASGFWQLMTSTALHYGCTNTNDIECATKAAAKYLRKLSGQFNSFDDVIAAYNMGGHNYLRKGLSEEAHWLVRRVNDIRNQDMELRNEK